MAGRDEKGREKDLEEMGGELLYKQQEKKKDLAIVAEVNNACRYLMARRTKKGKEGVSKAREGGGGRDRLPLVMKGPFP